MWAHIHLVTAAWLPGVVWELGTNELAAASGCFLLRYKGFLQKPSLTSQELLLPASTGQPVVGAVSW